jgi:putative DNA primase/helicase
MLFLEFNKLVNPKDEPMYFGVTYNSTPKVLKGSEIKDLAKSQDLEISWVVQPGYIVIETKQTSILPTITSKLEAVVVFGNEKDSLFIIAKDSFNRNTVLNRLACGISATTHSSGKTVLLPFKSKNNTSNKLANYEYLYGTDIGGLPNWLKPIKKISSHVDDGIVLPIVGDPKAQLLDNINKLKHVGYTKLLIEEVITLINKEFCMNSLSETELADLFKLSEEQLIKQFFQDKNFMHDQLGNYLIKNCFVKKDIVSKELYFYDERKKVYCTDVDYLMGYMTRLVPSLKQHQKQEVINYITSYLYEEAVRFNENPYTVVFKNGILDVLTLKFEPMTPDKTESIQINANYYPNMKAPIVDEYFHTATNGNKDIEQLLYEAIGYAMLKTNELQKAFLLVGSGRNGKSTYLDLVKEILGRENTTAISFKDLANTFRTSQMNNKLASLAGDISSTPLQDSDMVKSIISGDEIMVEQKYKDAHAKSLFATMFFAANKMPRTPDQSFGFYRRFTIIPFVADLNNVSRVDGSEFKRKLLHQNSIDYAAYRGAMAIHRLLTSTKEFTTPKEVVDMLEQYKIDNSSVLSWFNESFAGEIRNISHFTGTRAYEHYKKWCQDSVRHPLSLQNFVQQVKLEMNYNFPS